MKENSFIFSNCHVLLIFFFPLLYPNTTNCNYDSNKKAKTKDSLFDNNRLHLNYFLCLRYGGLRKRERCIKRSIYFTRNGNAKEKKRGWKKNNEISQWGMNSKNAECNLWKIAKFKSYIYIFCFYISRSSFLSKAPESNFCMGESGIKYSDVRCYPLAIFEYFRRLKLLNMNACSFFSCTSFNLKKKMKENLYIKTSYIRETLIDFFFKDFIYYRNERQWQMT